MDPVIDYLDISEVAQRCSFSVEHVRRLLRLGVIKGFKRKGGRRWRVDPADLREFLAGPREEPAPSVVAPTPNPFKRPVMKGEEWLEDIDLDFDSP